VKKVWISSIFSLGLHRHLKPLGIWRNNEEWVQEEVPSEDGDGKERANVFKRMVKTLKKTGN
jgi:hypothetical protein